MRLQTIYLFIIGFLTLSLISCDLLFDNDITKTRPILSRLIPGGTEVDFEEDPDGRIEAELEEEAFEEQVEREDFEEQEVEDELRDLDQNTNTNQNNPISLKNFEHGNQKISEIKTIKKEKLKKDLKALKNYNNKNNVKNAILHKNEKNNKLIINNKQNNDFDDSIFKIKMQSILDSIMQKMIQSEKITQTQKQLINNTHNFNTPSIHTNDDNIITKLMETLQLLANEDIAQPMSIKKIYTEANKNHTKFINSISTKNKYYGAPRAATIAYSKLISLLNYTINTIKDEDIYLGKYEYVIFLINEIKIAIDQFKDAINGHDLIIKNDNNTTSVYNLNNDLHCLIDRYNRSYY